MKELEVSIIIPCQNEGTNVLNTINSIRENSGGIAYEIIVVDNASDDGCCDFLRSMEENGIILIKTDFDHINIAKNVGAKNAKGDIFIFVDPHIIVDKSWLSTLVNALASSRGAVSPVIKPPNDDTVLVGGLTLDENLGLRWLPASDKLTPVPILPKSCLAISREAFETIEGFEEGFRAHGYDDLEFCLKLWLFGFAANVCPNTAVSHIYRGSRPFPVKNEDLHYNLLRVATLHFKEERLARVIAKIKYYEYFIDIFADVILSGAPERRRSIIERRVKDDDWYFQEFNISL